MIKMKFSVWSEIRKAAEETPRMYFSTVGDVVRLFRRACPETPAAEGRESPAPVFNAVIRRVSPGEGRNRRLQKNRKRAGVFGVRD
ncbi:MAG: hypothetical protein ABW051_04560 [Burkholderiaceae bacterium]